MIPLVLLPAFAFGMPLSLQWILANKNSSDIEWFN